MASYPWSTLGIAKTSDQRVIKSAFAQKLKVTRPEDDAEKFQKLVEARDHAMFMAANQPKQKPPRAAKSKKPLDELKKSKPKKSNKAKAPILESSFEDTVEKLDRNFHPEPISKPSQVQSISSTIGRFLKKSDDIQNILAAKRAIRKFATLSVNGKDEIEADLLVAVQSSLEIYGIKREDVPLSFGDEQLRCEVIERLDREYQWTENDRRIGELIYDEPEKLADYLQFYLHGKAPMAALKGQTSRNWGWLIWMALMLLSMLARMTDHRPY